MTEIAKLMVIAGLVLAAIGALFWAGAGRGWLGRLPGDIQFHRGNVSFYFPIVTCLLLSVILSFVLWLLRKF